MNGDTHTTLVDAPARHAIRHALDQTLLVEAAAGTGKTTELVGRIVQVILSGRASMGSIAALTFTEKAAGELKLRLRTELDRASFDDCSDAQAQQRARAALSELETADISTIHGFCTELLRRHPVEAEIDPDFQVAQAEREQQLLTEVFDDWFGAVLSQPPEGVRRVLARRAQDVRGATPEQQLLAAARQLVATRDFDQPFAPPSGDRARELEAVHDELRALAALGAQGGASDPLRRSLQRLSEELSSLPALGGGGVLDGIADAPDDPWDALEACLRRLHHDRDLWSGNAGRGQLYSSGLPRADVVARRDAARQRLTACMRDRDAEVAACLSRELRAVVDAYELDKRGRGLLDFFDLLLLTRALLQRSAAVRAQLQASFSHVFVDEFQDTDPVQSEIVLLLCADDPAQTEPLRSQPVPGKLFLVGDPKQSIYRFRRADIALYERVKRHLVGCGARVLQLTTSFRALPEIQACVNAAFEPAMDGDAERGQASYVPLHAFRASRPDQPALVALPVPTPFGYSGRVTKRAINASLPDAVAAWVAWLVRDSGWLVREHGRDVAVAPRHVCLLFRRFRGYAGDVTRDYVRALEACGLPHVHSGGRSLHDREEVIALRSVLYAIEWPDDRLHVYATLRGPFVAFHDETLFSFRQRTGHLSPTRAIPEAEHAALSCEERAVAELLSLLGELHKRRNRVPIAHTLSRFLDHVRAHAGLAFRRDGERALANVLRVLDFARSYERRSETASFRGFVGWLQDQADQALSAEAAVAEDATDALRIMTVHAAKGLEFPVVVLCDPTAPARPEHASRYIDPERKLWAQSLCESEPLELWQQRDKVREHDAAEVVRLSYVAVTRAQELLVVPVCGDEPQAPIEGWLSVLRAAIYPPRERCRDPVPTAYQLPSFGDDSVLARSAPMPDYNIAPGVHVPARGQQRVVFWDPALLSIGHSQARGVAQMQLLQGDGADAAQDTGQDDYARFRAHSQDVRQRAAQPGLLARSITQHAASAGFEPTVPLRIVETQEDRSARPRGARFGSLVHQLLEHLDYGRGAESGELAGLAQALGRELGASELERQHAAQCVQTALRHPFFERVRDAARRGALYRELPIVMCGEGGTLFDGVIDLVFQDRAQMCIVDFKTDVELGLLSHYETQLSMYAAAASRALGLPAEIVLLRV